MRKGIAIIITLVFILSAVIPLVSSDTTTILNGENDVVPTLKVEKKIRGGSEPYPEFVPMQESVHWDLEITIENELDDEGETLENIWVFDAFGAKLDLVVKNEDDGNPDYDYIFSDDDGPLYFDGEDDKYFGETGPVSWKLANGKYPESNGKHPATKLLWGVGDLGDGETKHLRFSVETIEYWTGLDNKNDKHSFMSTCHHIINDGPIATYEFNDETYYIWGDPVEVSVYDPTPGVDTDGDGCTDLEEATEYGTDPCDPGSNPDTAPPASQPIYVSGFSYPRSQAPLGVGNAVYLYDELLNTDNFGDGDPISRVIKFLEFVETIETNSLVDGDGNLLVDVFFAPLLDTDVEDILTETEANELVAFLEAGGILFICGNGGDQGFQYHPLFDALGWNDEFSDSTSGDPSGIYQTSTPISTPITTGPFGTVEQMTHTMFRPIITSSTNCVATGCYPSGDGCIIAEKEVGSNGGYISIMGDPLYMDFSVDPSYSSHPMNDKDCLTYFLNLFALAAD
jgi:hypothetical protein